MEAQLERAHGRRGGVFVAAAALLLVSLLVGGTSRPLNDLIVFLAALPLFFLLVAGATRAGLPWTGKLAIALVALAALQLVPLPPAVWTALPGRDMAAMALEGAGLDIGWRPLALDPGSAAMALATLFSPIVLHIAVANMEWPQVRRLLAILAAFALLSAIFGIFQRVAGGLNVLPTEHAGDSVGFFTNRNHHADLIIAAMLLLTALLPHDRVDKFRIALSAVVVLLVFAVVATTSRGGLALAVPGVLAGLLIIWRPKPQRALMLGAACVVAGLALLMVPAFNDIFTRFGGVAEDQRLTMARDSIVAARAMWSWGSGYGSFVPVYMAFEDLDMMEGRHVVAAHNDYLQLALEGGLAGVLTAIFGVGATGLLGWKLYNGASPAVAWGAWGVAVVLLAHSAFDYPLRIGAMAAVFAVCTGAAHAAAKRLPHGAVKG